MTKRDIEALNIRLLLGAIKGKIFFEDVSDSNIHDIVEESYKGVSLEVSIIGNSFNLVYADGLGEDFYIKNSYESRLYLKIVRDLQKQPTLEKLEYMIDAIDFSLNFE